MNPLSVYLSLFCSLKNTKKIKENILFRVWVLPDFELFLGKVITISCYLLNTNLGFYPISKYVLENGMIDEERLHHYFVNNGLSKFEYQKITET